MARQLVFASNITLGNLIDKIAKDENSAIQTGRYLPYYQKKKYCSRELIDCGILPNDNSEVVETNGYFSLIYDLQTQRVIHPRTQDLSECPADRVFAELHKITSIRPVNIELVALYFDHARAFREIFTREKEAWAKELERYKKGEFNLGIKHLLQDQARDR